MTSRIRVAVATIERGPGYKPILIGYTRWGTHECCWHEVDAVNGTHAKTLAIAEHRAKCMAPKTSSEVRG